MFSKSFIALALAGSAFANPLIERGTCGDSCAAAVTGSAALGDHGIRASHCASFLATTVTPPAITVTATVTGTSSSSKPAWKRSTVTYCPNKVPVYATSACGGSEEPAATAAYSSACSCLGFTGDSTTTIAPTTTTKTVYVVPTYAGSCSSATSTVTITTSIAGPTGSGGVKTVTVTATNNVTVTATSPSTPTDSTCLTDADAVTITNDFINFLEYTGANFNTALATSLLADNFTDTSDSINFMAGYALTSVTFPSKGAFIGGQGAQPPIPTVVTLNIWHDCRTITWRWRAFVAPQNIPVTGINVMITNTAKQLETNYSEFDNGAWLYNYGNPQCPKANCTTTATTASTTGAGKRGLNMLE